MPMEGVLSLLPELGQRGRPLHAMVLTEGTKEDLQPPPRAVEGVAGDAHSTGSVSPRPPGQPRGRLQPPGRCDPLTSFPSPTRL